MLGIFLDTETNGLNPNKHSILEVAFKIIKMSTGECLFAFQSIIAQTRFNWEKSDPLSLQTNGLTWEEISKGAPKQEVSGAIVTALARHQIRRQNAVFICQNPSFDRSFFSQIVDYELQEMLEWPYHWLDLASMYWAKHLEKEPLPWNTGLSKDKIAQTYHLPPEKTPHRAMQSVDHLILCYQSILGFPCAAIS